MKIGYCKLEAKLTIGTNSFTFNEIAGPIESRYLRLRHSLREKSCHNSFGFNTCSLSNVAKTPQLMLL